MARSAITDTPTAGQPAKAATVLALVGNDSDHETRLLAAAAAASAASTVASSAQGTANTGVTAAATAQAAAVAAQTTASAAAAGLTRTAVKTAAYTAAAGDLVPVDTTSGAVTITLPAAPAAGSTVAVKLVTQGGTNAVTVVCGGSDVFNVTAGATTLTLLVLRQGVTLLYASGIWTVTGDSLPLGGLDLRYPAIASTIAATYQSKQLFDSFDQIALRNFHVALGDRDNNPCDVLHLGDSITQGYRASTIAKRWSSVFRDTMRSRFPQVAAGGFNYIPAQAPSNYLGVFSDTPTVTTGGTQSGGSGYALDQGVDYFTAAGHKVVYTFTGTGFDVFYYQWSGGGTLYWKVDGGTSTNISTAGSSTYQVSQAIRGLTVGVHTVELGYVSGGSTFCCGGMAYNGDETKGIRSWNASLQGTTSSYWWNTAKNYWFNQIPYANPDLVTIELGPNDYANPGGTVPVATFKANVTSIIATIKSKVTGYVPSFVLLPTWAIDTTGATPVDTWANYVAAMYQIAVADPDGAVCVLDWQQRVNPGSPSTVYGLLPDKTHPADAGNRYLGELLATFVSPH